MNPRPYQSEVLPLIQASFKAGNKRVIRVAPTGSGKSVEMSIMTLISAQRNKRVWILTHRLELFGSMIRHLAKQGIPCVELDSGSAMPAGDYRVMVAMERTIWNRIRKDKDAILPPDLIIVDEGHLNHFTKILEAYPNTYTITFTATPKGKHIHKLYKDLIQNIDIPELIEQGYLVPCKAYQMKDKAQLETVKMDGEEFDEADLFQHFDKSELYKGLIEEYERYTPGQKAIVFCINIEHTEKTYKMLKDAGYPAFMVHSGNKQFPYDLARRAREVTEFESCPNGIMVNSGILTTGYDHNLIRVIILYRATTILSLFLQMCGRGSRPILGPDGRADLSAKDRFTILDFGSNHTRLGLWNQPRKWKIEDPKKAKKQKAAPVKTCDCGAMLFASVRVCEFCGKEFPKPTHDMIEGVMCEVDTDIPLGLMGKRIDDLSIDELISCQRTGKLKASYVWRILRTKEKEAANHEDSPLSEYARKIGYSFSWIAVHRHKCDEEKEVGFNRSFVIR